MFADAVKEVLERKFKGDVKRVVKSWELMDQDYIHKEYIEHAGTMQEANSYIEGLKVDTFHDPYQFEWARGLKEHAAEIQDEFRRVAIEDAATLDSVGNNVWATAANSTSAQSYGPDWKTLALMDRCVWDETNTKLFPVATRLLRELGVPCIEAFYARMTPGSKIKPHSDYCNFALTAHLGLDVPEGQCSISVGKDTREWRNGEMLLFDTSLLHEAENTAPRMRYILMLRVWHPDLSPAEVDAIRYIFAALDTPEIVEPDLRALAPEILAPAPPPAERAAAPAMGGAGGGMNMNRAERRANKKRPKPAKSGGGGFGK